MNPMLLMRLYLAMKAQEEAKAAAARAKMLQNYGINGAVVRNPRPALPVPAPTLGLVRG